MHIFVFVFIVRFVMIFADTKLRMGCVDYFYLWELIALSQFQILIRLQSNYNFFFEIFEIITLNTRHIIEILS